MLLYKNMDIFIDVHTISCDVGVLTLTARHSTTDQLFQRSATTP